MLRSFEGWVQGQRREIQAIQIDRHLVEINTALAYLQMLKHALADGVDLVITSGLRTWDQQRELYDRLRPQGIPTARPGHSAHHYNAIDIRTGITFAEFKAGKRSKIYDWLHLNSETYNFIRAVPSEPWHYEYTGKI